MSRKTERKKIIVLYGPPGVGKLTIAKHLANKTGYKILHNHLTIEPLADIFPIFDPSFIELNEIFRKKIIRHAAHDNIGLIVTFCYVRKHDDVFVRSIQRNARLGRTKACFVHLTAPVRALEERILSRERKKFHKIHKKKILHEALRAWEPVHPIPHVKSLVIDTAKHGARKSAELIIEYCKV